MQHEHLASLLARWEEELEQGRDLTPEQLCAGRADLVEPLRQAIEGYRRLRQQFGSLLDNDATVPPEEGTLDANATMPPLPDQVRRDVAMGVSSPPGYEIIGELGRGGMGVVYRARQIGLNRVVALKMILSGGHAGAEEKVRFLAEAEAIAKVRHPGIVQVHDFGTHQGLPFFSLEFCDGGSLADRLNGTPLPPREAAEVVEQIARAVHAAHAAGIVHRDLKPANVMLQRPARQGERDVALVGSDALPDGRTLDGVAKITDFGLAKRVEGGGQTQTGAVMGTPSYMAPEQAEGKKDVGPLADVYAVGAILYECLSGRPPFRAATTFDTILQVVSDEPVPLRQLNAKVPLDLETICQCCLQKDPAKRYASAAALADDLRRWLDGEPVMARRLGPGERLAKWARRKPALAALLAVSVAALLTVAGGGVLFSLSLTAQVRKAEEAERRAADRATDAEREQMKAERMLYASRIASAQREWEVGNLNIAWHHLENCREEYRGWEHRYLRGLFSRNQRTFPGPTSSITQLAWSPDGQRILCGDGKTIKVWDVERGEVAHSLEGLASMEGLAWSSDGKRILGVDNMKTVMVWDASRGDQIFSVGVAGKELTGEVEPSSRWSPDGRRVLGGGGNTLKVWDAQTSRQICSLKGKAEGVLSIAWSPDGNRILTSDIENNLKLWDLDTGLEALPLKAPGTVQWRLTWSPDGKRFLTADAIGREPVKIWDAATGREILVLEGHRGGEVYPLSWSSDGKRILTGDGNPTAYTCTVWNADTGRKLFTLTPEAGPYTIIPAAWSPDGRRILTSSGYCTIKVWDAENGRYLLSLKGHKHAVFTAKWSPDSKRIASASNDGTLKVWTSVVGQERSHLVGHTDGVTSVAFSPDGRRIVSGSYDRTAKVWDVRIGGEVFTLRGHTDRVNAVAYSPQGQRIVSVSQDRTVRVWDAEAGQHLHTLEGHAGPVLCVAVSPDGGKIVSGGGEHDRPGELKVWDAAKGREIYSLKGHTDRVISVAVSPDSKRILTGSADGSAKLWDSESGKEVLSIKGCSRSVAFSHDGRRILGADGRAIREWDVADGRELFALDGGPGGVACVAKSPDGTRTASGTGSGVLALWNPEWRHQVCTLEGHTGAVNCVAWSPDGSRIVSGGSDRTLRLWEVSGSK